MIVALRAEAERLLDLTAAADPATPVPTCPAWNLQQLLEHTTGAWRWGTQVLLAGDAYTERSVVPGEPRESLAALLDALARTTEDQPTWTPVGRTDTALWWHRKMTVETALHRWDASHALGRDEPLDPAIALAGIDEHLADFLPGMVRRRREQWGTVELQLTDLGIRRLVELGGDGASTVAGTASQVLLWMWCRPSDVEAPAPLRDRWQALAI